MSNLTKTKCILWTGCTDKDGYGRRTINKKTIYVHRLAYCQANGLELEHIKGKVVRHSCDTPGCYNPDHLSLGTHQDNSNDMKARGRQRAPRGEAHYKAKITAAQAQEIKARYGTGLFTQSALSRMFGIDQAMISRIVNNQSWRTL